MMLEFNGTPLWMVRRFPQRRNRCIPGGTWRRTCPSHCSKALNGLVILVLKQDPVSLTLETNTLGQLTASGSVGAEPFECTAPTTPGTITYQGGSGSDPITRNLAPSDIDFHRRYRGGDDTPCLLSDFAGSVATGAGDDSVICTLVHGIRSDHRRRVR